MVGFGEGRGSVHTCDRVYTYTYIQPTSQSYLLVDAVEAVGGRDGRQVHDVGGDGGHELVGDALARHHRAHLVWIDWSGVCLCQGVDGSWVGMLPHRPDID